MEQAAPRPGAARPGAAAWPARGRRPRTMPELPVDLAGAPAGQPAGPQTGPTHLAVRDLGARGGDHPVAVEVGAPAELDPVAEDRDRPGRGRRGRARPQCGRASRRSRRRAVLRLVALTLVDLPGVDLQVAAARAGDADPDLADLLAGLPAPGQQQLGTGDVDRRGRSPRGRAAGGGCRGPVRRRRAAARASGRADPGSGRRWTRRRPLAGRRRSWRNADLTAVPKPNRSLAGIDRVHDPLVQGLLQQVTGGVGAVVVDGDQPGGAVRQLSQRVQGVGQPARRIEGDQHGGDVQLGERRPEPGCSSSWSTQAQDRRRRRSRRRSDRCGGHGSCRGGTVPRPLDPSALSGRPPVSCSSPCRTDHPLDHVHRSADARGCPRWAARHS